MAITIRPTGPSVYRSSHRPGREESSAGRGNQGSWAALCPALPASATGPIVSAIWPAKAALPPRPPPLPRLKLINGSAYRHRHRLLALSAWHIYLCAEQKAHRGEGSCAPALVRERGAVAPRARPTPLNTRGLAAGEASVAGAQLRRPHAQPRAEGRQAGGRRRLVTISARILTRQDLPWGGGARGPGLQGEYPAPPPRPGPHLCLGLGSVKGGQRGLASAHAAVPVPNAHCSADPAGPGRSTRSRPYRR